MRVKNIFPSLFSLRLFFPPFFAPPTYNFVGKKQIYISWKRQVRDLALGIRSGEFPGRSRER